MYKALWKVLDIKTKLHMYKRFVKRSDTGGISTWLL